MSLSDEGGYGGDQRGSEPGQTRTRLPDGGGDLYGSGRRSRAGLSSRNLVTIVGVVVLLIAAIAFANRSGGGGTGDTASSDAPKGADAQPTAPTGTKPVTGKNGSIATGFAKTEQGAQSAAANYAVALHQRRHVPGRQTAGDHQRCLRAIRGRGAQERPRQGLHQPAVPRPDRPQTLTAARQRA